MTPDLPPRYVSQAWRTARPFPGLAAHPMHEAMQVDGPENPDWCYGCCKVEPLPETYYRVCPECFHVYETADDLVRLYLSIAGSLDSPAQEPAVADDIYFCQVCTHDF